MVKGYLVAVEAVPEAALGVHFTDWPAAVIPLFVAMMFGASANIVSIGICARNGKRVTFAGWLRYGLPVTACQLTVSALYVLALFYFKGRRLKCSELRTSSRACLARPTFPASLARKNSFYTVC
jgi:hypothetical protein